MIVAGPTRADIVPTQERPRAPPKKENKMTIEYRVKPVTRYIVTRHDSSAQTDEEFQRNQRPSGSVRQIGGEHDNADTAYQVGYALAFQERENLCLPPGDMGVIFPEHPANG